jgi:hypothetical protein
MYSRSSNLDRATALNHSHFGVYSIDLVWHPMLPSEADEFCLVLTCKIEI